MEEPTIRKGRRGLARKNVLARPEDVSSSTTLHNVYSSCVSSHGYRNMMGDVSHTPDGSDDSIVSPETVNTTSVAAEDLSQHVAGFSGYGKQNESQDERDSDISFEEEELNAPLASDPNSLRSPTPPPTDTGAMCKRKKMSRKLTAALRALNTAKGNLNTTPNTPFTKARRKRGRKMPIFTNIDTSTFPLEDSSPIVKTEMILKVRYLSNIHRLQLKLTEQFHSLLSRLSQETGQEERYLSLYLNDQVLPLSKTPKEVGLTVADIIECHCVKDANGGVTGDESVTILVQCSNSKRKTEMVVTMRQTFKDTLEKFAEQAGINASSYSFCFDGDDVGPNDTPLSLELEDGDILDLVPASKPGARSRSAWKNSVITIT